MPELAILATLHHGLVIASRTIIAANPGLEDPDTPYWLDRPCRSQQAAERLLAQISLLRTLTTQYLEVIEQDRRDEQERIARIDPPF